MKLTNKIARALGALALVLLTGKVTDAQRIRGELRIEVRDPQGAAVPTKAELVSDVNEFGRTFHVGADGRYVIQDPSSDPQNPSLDFGHLSFMLGQAWAEEPFETTVQVAPTKPFRSGIGVLLMGVASIAREGMAPQRRVNLDNR